MTAGWRHAVCVETRTETPTARSIRLRIDDLDGAPTVPPALPGQHIDVRLTADDGYQAVRSYSLSGTPAGGPFGRPLPADEVEITIEQLPDGEVSPYLVQGLEVGDSVEIRGPIGGWFVWHPTDSGPVQLIGGGSGVAPLVAMLRARVASPDAERPDAPFRLLYSVRTPENLYYRRELEAFADKPGIRIDPIFTRATPAGSVRPAGRINALDVASATHEPGDGIVFVCGPNAFVASAADLLIARGHDPALIRTERFGGAG